MSGQTEPISVSREIRAPAADIFRLLANPARHVELDGSDMVQGAVSAELVAGIGVCS